MRRSLVAASLALAAACASAQPAAEAAPPETAIRALDSLWARMYAEHDTAAAMRLYADDLVFTSANGTVKSKSDELRDVRPSPGLVMEFFRTTPAAVRVEGDSATVAGTAEWRFTMNGRPREVRRGYEHRYARGGPLGWRIVRVWMRSAP